ncbi:hypothetical protein R77591_02712 [Ralstonia mannitolilytica]|uniref:Uncharacterized protein n=1 Tax=Ralstonia mannitolilytica TaxID=105219 RepID=A0AAD2EHE9_9RALS|nr:hypothetical protein R77591_02712 [Ralstonia mannitolilytica]CAJ0896876.1 hypothetical protein R77569_04642 [Ralstonia mannitolilytica]
MQRDRRISGCRPRRPDEHAAHAGARSQRRACVCRGRQPRPQRKRDGLRPGAEGGGHRQRVRHAPDARPGATRSGRRARPEHRHAEHDRTERYAAAQRPHHQHDDGGGATAGHAGGEGGGSLQDADRPDGRSVQPQRRLRQLDVRRHRQFPVELARPGELQQSQQAAAEDGARCAARRWPRQGTRRAEPHGDQRAGSELPRRRQGVHPGAAELWRRHDHHRAAGRDLWRGTALYAHRHGKRPHQPEGRARSVGTVAHRRGGHRCQHQWHDDPAAHHHAARFHHPAGARRSELCDRRAHQEQHHRQPEGVAWHR